MCFVGEKAGGFGKRRGNGEENGGLYTDGGGHGGYIVDGQIIEER
jgi:hypothetical protein